MVIHHLSKTTSKEAMEQRFRNSENSEWGAYPAQTMCDETRTFGVPLSDGKKRTLGDLYDLTPKDLISKVMLEEKVFKTWHHGRTVLLGDGIFFFFCNLEATHSCALDSQNLNYHLY
jgi:hypothetical protein